MRTVLIVVLSRRRLALFKLPSRLVTTTLSRRGRLGSAVQSVEGTYCERESEGQRETLEEVRGNRRGQEIDMLS